MKRSTPKNFLIFITLGAIALSVVLYATNLYFGDLNQDEGFYLCAAKRISEGKMVYRDFAYTQGPVLPYVYSGFYGIVRRFGVAGGRLLTGIFGILSAIISAWLTARIIQIYFRRRNQSEDIGLSQWIGAVATFTLIACNVYQSYFTTIVKTYALCALFLSAGFLSLSFRKHPSLGGIACFVSGVLLALAAGSRVSAGIVLPIVGIWLIIHSFDSDISPENFPSRLGVIGQKFGWLYFGIGGGVTLIGLSIPFYVMSREGFLFGLFEYHTGREIPSLFQTLILKAGFISRFVQAYTLFMILALAVIFSCAIGLWKRVRKPNHGITSDLLWICGVAISIVHFSAPFPYDDYQVIVYPIFAIALITTFMEKLPKKLIPAFLIFLLFASMATSFSSPINQEWFVIGQDRIWWQFKEKSSLSHLRDVAQEIRAEMGSSDVTMLTQDTYLAIEANCDVPSGMELGPFCYYPEMPRKRAEAINVLNREMMAEMLESSDAPIAAFSDYGLSIECPQIEEVPAAERKEFFEIIQRNYILKRIIPHFGQAHTPLRIYMLHNL